MKLLLREGDTYFSSVYFGTRVDQSLVSACVVFCRVTLGHVCPFLCYSCPSFLDLRLLVITVVSSNFPYNLIYD